MGLPNETSWECEDCHVFNIQNGVIKEGCMYCDSCWEERTTKESKK